MKKKKKISVRVLSALLTLCLMLSVVFSAPVTVTAATVGERNDITVSDVAVSKVESIDGNEEVKRTPIRRLYEEEGNDLNKTIWLNDDGTRTMTIYDYPVKFVNAAGQIQDISLDVAEAADGSGAFKTAAGWTNTVFPSKITDGVTLSGNGESLKLTPVMPQGSLVASAERSNKLVAKDKVSRKDNKTVSYNYDNKTNIEYSLTYNGFKEDIVVNEYTGQTEYSFLLETNGLTLINNNGSYHLEDAKGNIKASVGDVIIFTADERNNTMGYMTHTTVKANHSYFLTIHVDADWLRDEKTVYPIRIDPTLEMTDTEKLVEDVTIYSGGASNPSSAVLYVGRRPDTLGTSRVLLKFPNLDLSDISSAQNVVSAGIRMRDLMCETDPMGVYCYIYDGNNWEDNTATWANNAEGYTHFMSHNDVSYDAGVTKNPKHSYYFSITPAVKYWKLTDAEKAARPDNYDMEKGIMLKAKNDTTMDYQYKSFGSYNRSNYRPTIEIVYNNDTESPAKPFGWFDKVTDTEISGWAWCLDYPSAELVCSALLYDVVTGSRVSVITGRAQNYRWDVKAAGYGTGCYGFNLPVDWSSLPLGDYRILVEVWDVNNQLSYVIPHSPMYYSNEGLQISPLQATLRVGDTLSLATYTHNIGESTGDVTWSSNNEGIATVSSNGVVTAVSPGPVTITASLSTGEQAICSIYVPRWPLAESPSILSRAEWGAVSARDTIETRGVAQRIIFHHSAEKFSSQNIDDIKAEIRRIQNYHMTDPDRKYDDIAYHFIIDPAGNIWQGRSIEHKGAHALGYNNDIGVLVLGDFESRWQNLWSPNTLNDQQKEAMKSISKWLCCYLELEKITADGAIAAPISMHSEVSGTECPGDNLEKWIKEGLRPYINDWCYL